MTDNRRPFFIGVLLIILLVAKTKGQQAPHYSQYMYNMEVLNPAFVGAKADLSISLLSRQQWVGIEGAPETNTFSINGRLLAGLGFGATVVNDKIGLAENTNINIDASYTIVTSQYGRISFGLKGGLTFFNNNLSNGITPDNEIYASSRGSFPNFGFGGLYYNDKFFVGISIPNILKSSTFKTVQTFTNESILSINNYFIASGLIFNISENIIYKPTTIVKYSPNLPLSIDINSNLIYKDKIEAGISYRFKNSLSALFALHINKSFRVGYSYEHNLANYGSNLSSHEIIIRIDLKIKRNMRWLFHNQCFF